MQLIKVFLSDFRHDQVIMHLYLSEMVSKSCVKYLSHRSLKLFYRQKLKLYININESFLTNCEFQTLGISIEMSSSQITNTDFLINELALMTIYNKIYGIITNFRLNFDD